MDTAEALSRNLRYLMQVNKLTEEAVARRSGVSQKTINNMLNKASSPTLDKVDKVANSFGLTLWHLIMANLPDDLKNSPSISELYENFAAADPELRSIILAVSRRAGNSR